MPVRIKITLLFTLIMFVFISLLCGFFYYFSYVSRLENIKTFLTNRALTTANMLSKPGIFDHEQLLHTDSIIIRSINNKSIQVYSLKKNRIYVYSDKPEDTLTITSKLFEEARVEPVLFFTSGKKEAISYYDGNVQNGIIIFAAAIDQHGKEKLQHLRVILLMIISVGILVAFTTGYFISRILLRPIKKIADDVNFISAQSLTHRIKSGVGNDEWHYLTDTLNDLLNRLQESFEIQRRFISSASHELSTPLTSISSQLEVSLQRHRAAEDYRQVMQSVHQDVRHLSKLTQTLLEFATVTGTTGGIEIKLIRIDEVLLRLPGEMTKMNAGYSVKLEFDQLPENEERLLVFGNAELLFTAVKNIVSNACKYSSDKVAKVKLSISQNEIVVAIEDSGKGIPESELNNIFQPFYRAEDSRGIAGFGVGLPLVNRIVKLHKGQIKIKSIVEMGTTFFVHLPMAGFVDNLKSKLDI